MLNVNDSNEVLNSLLASLDARPQTKRTYERALKQFFSWLEGCGIGLIDAERSDILTYREYLTASHAVATVNAYMTAVRCLYAYLESEGACRNIAVNVKGMHKDANSPKNALTMDQARDLLKKKPETLEELRDYAIINLMLRRGLRTVEVMRANIGDLKQISGRAVLMVQGKGHDTKDDFVVMSEDCLKPIYAYLEARGERTPEAPLFASLSNRNTGGRLTTKSISRICDKAFKEQGIKSASLTAHSLRHTAVTLSLIGGATIQEAQAMARHKSINTTMIYAHNLEKLEGKAEGAIDGLLSAGKSEPQSEPPEHNSLSGTIKQSEPLFYKSEPLLLKSDPLSEPLKHSHIPGIIKFNRKKVNRVVRAAL